MTRGTLTDGEPLTIVRRWLLALLAIGMIGSSVDLVLLEHYEEAWQIVPLAIMAIGLVVIVWVWARESAGAVTALRVVMLLAVATGLLGILLHYYGNREFQLEMDPGLNGWALFAKIATAKAPPALAPASMVQLGLLGLLFTYRHPALTPTSRGDRPFIDRSLV